MQILVRKVPPAGVGVEHPLLDRIYAARGISDSCPNGSQA